MNCRPIPTADQQLTFLKNMQRLLSEGSFVASYKFALLHALADLAILKGEDTGAPLQLSTHEIGERFIELYWQQVRPFPVNIGRELILKQNTGRQADVVTKIVGAHRTYAGSLFRCRQDSLAWRALVQAVARTVRVMPLWKLQTVGTDRLDFLYDNSGDGCSIVLKAGVGYCLRAFHEALCGLFRNAWVEYLRRNNQQDLGHAEDLQGFLFGQERAALHVYGPILKEVQHGACFYCRGALRAEFDVDHFIPWSRSHSDLAHNFVLSHRGCNGAKSDHLAFERHLEAWAVRNHDLGPELDQRFSAASVIHDVIASRKIAEWAYFHTEQAQGQVWIADRQFKRLDSSWRKLLVA